MCPPWPEGSYRKNIIDIGAAAPAPYFEFLVSHCRCCCTAKATRREANKQKSALKPISRTDAPSENRNQTLSSFSILRLHLPVASTLHTPFPSTNPTLLLTTPLLPAKVIYILLFFLGGFKK